MVFQLDNTPYNLDKKIMNKNQLIWVQEGYFVFGRKGPTGINIEHLAKKLKKSKSSFYHYFGDLEVFQEALLNYHLERADIIASKGSQCKNMDPDVINLMIDTKDDLLFSKQLRLNLQNPAIKRCFDLSFKTITDSFVDKWNLTINLKHNSRLGKVIFHLLVDNFFLEVNEENLSYEWFHNYINNLRSIIKQINSTSDK